MNPTTAEMGVDWRCRLLLLVGGGMGVPEPLLGLFGQALGWATQPHNFCHLPASYMRRQGPLWLWGGEETGA